MNVAVYLLFAALLIFYLPQGTILFSFRHPCGGRLAKRQPAGPCSLDLLQRKSNVRGWLHVSFRCVQRFYIMRINLILIRTYVRSMRLSVSPPPLFAFALLFFKLNSFLPSLLVCYSSLRLFSSASSWCLNPQSFPQSLSEKRLL